MQIDVFPSPIATSVLEMLIHRVTAPSVASQNVRQQAWPSKNLAVFDFVRSNAFFHLRRVIEKVA